MLLIKADYDRVVELSGVPGPVQRPVDIDQTTTHFCTLRTLRVYRFSPPVVIDGHAEGDEVLIVVLAGSVDLVMRSENWTNSATSFRLKAANDQEAVACAAYLPPHAEYRLTPLMAAEVAYARASAAGTRAPGIVTSAPRMEDSGVCVLFDESSHGERLRCRLIQVNAARQSVAVAPIRDCDRTCEMLIHVRTKPERSAVSIATESSPSTVLESWDTIAFAPGSDPILRISPGSTAVGFVVTATSWT